MRSGLVCLLLLCATVAHAGQLCINIPDDKEVQIIDAVARARGYQPLVIDNVNVNPTPQPNPQTPKQFVREQLKTYVVDIARGQIEADATETARVQARQTADDLVKGTQ